VSLVLEKKKVSVSAVDITSHALLDYNSKNFESDASKFNEIKKTQLLNGNITQWFNTPSDDVFFIEGKIRFIDELKEDNHGGIVWYDGTKEYYVFLRHNRLAVFNSIDKEFVSVEIDRKKEFWHELRIVYLDETIDIFVDNELKLQILKTKSGDPLISRVGINTFNSVAEFEPLKLGIGTPSFIDVKNQYYYPISALALSNIKYKTIEERDLSKFSTNNIILTFDPSIDESSKYLEFVKMGGTLTILNTNKKFDGMISSLF